MTFQMDDISYLIKHIQDLISESLWRQRFCNLPLIITNICLRLPSVNNNFTCRDTQNNLNNVHCCILTNVWLVVIPSSHVWIFCVISLNILQMWFSISLPSLLPSERVVSFCNQYHSENDKSKKNIKY